MIVMLILPIKNICLQNGDMYVKQAGGDKLAVDNFFLLSLTDTYSGMPYKVALLFKCCFP